MTDHEVLLETRIADRAGVQVEDVRDVFTAYGLPLISPPARPRNLRLHRLRVSGVRSGKVYPGEFDTTLRFHEGLTGLVAANLRGKTSVLELVTWCLRGTPRELNGVRHWLQELDLDVMVAGQPLGFRLNLADEEVSSAVVLAASDIAALGAVREPDPAHDIVPLLRAANSESYSEQVQALMMDRLDLHPLVNSYQETGSQTHGWPAYFGAIYLPAGRDKALLGDVLTGGLPGRLLQVFLDLPAAAALTRVKTTSDVLAAKRKARQAEDRAARDKRNAERSQIEAQLGQARERLAGISVGEPGDRESLADLAATAVRLARDLADAQDSWNEAMRAHRRARGQRQRDEKLLNDVTESATARALFHGLDPKACPRCDQPIAGERRRQEHESHECAVCSRPVPSDDDTPEEVIYEAQQRLEDSRTIEKLAGEALEDQEAVVARLSGELEDSQERLRRAESAAQVPVRAEAREEVLRLEGALSVFPELPPLPDDPIEEKALKVLRAATKILEGDHETAAKALFAELNKAIVELGVRFGIDSLESVKIDRAARLEVTKGGGRPGFFGAQSPGERLRLRIAVVIALLRIGAAHNVSTHPGLLLIDSPKAEETQDLDLRTLLGELSAVASENNLQVLITTVDRALAHDVLPKENIIESEGNKPLW
ncbi:hypothetical protein [Actinomadura miaoliensis]|uniref:ATP-binding protein n=1 Tax=Actinomadura miaoliensis TaxID=430685 RepID=A0ABP7VZU2_9ACTN